MFYYGKIFLCLGEIIVWSGLNSFQVIHIKKGRKKQSRGIRWLHIRCSCSSVVFQCL